MPVWHLTICRSGSLMTSIGRYTDTLRAIGRYLEQVGASDITVIEEPNDLGVVWRGLDGTRRARAFGAADLWSLRASARLFRGAGRTIPHFPPTEQAGTLTERLRVLGAIADAVDVVGLAITETSDGFRFSARQQGRPITLTFANQELITRANQSYRRRPAV
jgi:hypothetical protein